MCYTLQTTKSKRMRRSNKINKTEVEKEIARRKYGERQIDKWVKWSFSMRGKVLWKELMEQIKRYKLDG
tara:strand:- start:564 stop:770 length:207 start_codon:yes stop_codon:yes gene_type:complete